MTEQIRLAPGESPKPVDPALVAKNVYRGGMWELVGIGKPLPAIAMGVLLVLLLVFAVTGLPWPSIVFSAVLIVVAIWSQRNVQRWAVEHNARVAPSAVSKSNPSTPGTKPKPKANRAKPVKNRRRP